MDFLQILLVCDADQVSHFGFMNLQTSSPLISRSPPPLPSCICPSIIPRVGLGGRVLIPPSHLSLLWTDEEVEEGDGDGGRRRGRRLQITFHNISVALWGKMERHYR